MEWKSTAGALLCLHNHHILAAWFLLIHRTTTIPPSTSAPPKKPTKRPTVKPTRTYATREKIAVLKKWVNDHNGNLTPTTPQTERLAILAGMTLKRVHYWFANARRRFKKKIISTVTTNEHCMNNEIASTGRSNQEAAVKSVPPQRSCNNGNRSTYSDNVTTCGELSVAYINSYN